MILYLVFIVRCKLHLLSTFVIDRMVKYPLVKNVHRHQIGVVNNDGDFEPKIFFNFSFTHYVHCSERKIQVRF